MIIEVTINEADFIRFALQRMQNKLEEIQLDEDNVPYYACIRVWKDELDTSTVVLNKFNQAIAFNQSFVTKGKKV